ncbi:probable NOT transcription complex subunit VIP2 isoform X2 [Rutidosis leptorrhynchoides]|uniref:probable NOT transcription complex subunit VIP2 isoform X2 n=1 Tax=Rutidosis leptorrhynchoides TaxID=125765 RepID=UPI003A98D0B9
MSGILNSGVNGSTTTFPDATGRAFTAAFSSQLGSSAGEMNHNDAIGLRSINGNFSIPSMPGAYTSRNSGLNGHLNGVQPSPGSISNGRYSVNSLPGTLSQSAASSLGLSGITNNGGSGIAQGLGNREQLISSMAMGNIINGGSIGRSLSSGGLNMPGVASRLNLTAPQMASLFGNSYSNAGGPLSQNHYQAGSNHLSSMALLTELNRDHSFDMNDFPQLSGHLSSAGGSQRQLGALARRQNVGFMQQNQEFSIQNEDFPALPGYKGGNEFPVNMHQKEQLRDNAVSVMQSQQHLPVGRSNVFSLGGGGYSSHQQQQQHAPINNGASYLSTNTQDLHFHGSEARNSGMLATGSRPVNLSNTVPGGSSYDQLLQQYQHFQKQSQIRLASPFRDQEFNSTQASQSVADRFGLLGLLNVIRMNNPDLTPLALGIDLMTLGLNLNSPDNLYKKFSSPWSDESSKGEPHYAIPECFNTKQPSPLNQDSFSRFPPESLFYIFYSMPKDEAQLFAANELHNRGWFYHRELHLWFSRAPNMELLVKTSSYERGCYYCFDPNTWETVRKDNFVIQYEMVEDRPVVPRR